VVVIVVLLQQVAQQQRGPAVGPAHLERLGDPGLALAGEHGEQRLAPEPADARGGQPAAAAAAGPHRGEVQLTPLLGGSWQVDDVYVDPLSRVH
jgi:hypothetical protein